MNEIKPLQISEINSLISIEQTEMLYRNISLLAVGTLITSTIYILAVFDSAESYIGISIWYATLLLITCARMWDSKQYHQQTTTTITQINWNKRFLLGSTCAGFCWGLMPIIAFSSDYIYQIMAAVFLVGVTGAAMSTLSFSWPVISIFILTCLIPMELRMLYESSSFSTIVSYLLALYIFIALVSSRRFFINANTNIRLKLEATEREDYLKALKDNAEQASEAKTDFLSSISHELRTPLNAIIGYTQLIQYDSSLEENHRRSIKQVNHAGKHLLSLVNQILDLARIEGRKSNLKTEKIDAKLVIEEAIAFTYTIASDQGIDLKIDMPRHPVLHTDPLALKQVILNLVSNAIKYNNRGGHVIIRSKQKEVNLIRFEVIDDGPGISEDDLNQIFTPFTRLDAAERGIDGTGIGLSITRDLVREMGGTLGVESTPGEGSTFWFTLHGELIDAPNEDSSGDTEAETIQRPAATSPNTSNRILVVEDNLTNQLLLCNQLQTLGYEHDVADNGKIAQQKASEDSYALIPTDCNMPVMNGYELARALRDAEDATPIIGITADAFPESEQRCLSAGMTGRITKPVELQTLQQVIELHLASTPEHIR